jgi:hypothetical protein
MYSKTVPYWCPAAGNLGNFVCATLRLYLYLYSYSYLYLYFMYLYLYLYIFLYIYTYIHIYSYIYIHMFTSITYISAAFSRVCLSVHASGARIKSTCRTAFPAGTHTVHLCTVF